MSEDTDQHPAQDGLPGDQEQNHEQHRPMEPTKKPAGEADGGDPDSGGEAGEGSQSTGSPHAAG
jgi:hypothetical protein